MTAAELFTSLNGLNVNDVTEKKGGLTYLSWAWAWAEFKKICPDATYEVVKQENGLPYVVDPETGYMVFTRVTAAGITHEMWLPVMNHQNKALKPPAADMFVINKTIMRCLTKNLAMFGLGLYIYAGEDLPEESPVYCTECEEEIKPFKGKKGIMSPKEFATQTGGLCLKCYKQLKALQDEGTVQT